MTIMMADSRASIYTCEKTVLRSEQRLDNDDDDDGEHERSNRSTQWRRNSAVSVHCVVTNDEDDNDDADADDASESEVIIGRR